MKLHTAILALSLLLVACSQTHVLQTVTVDRAQELFSQEDTVVIDVRTAEEYANGHLQNAKQIDFYSENFKDELNKLPKNDKYLIYCSSGKRSGKALEIMRELEFTEVYDLEGGIGAWSEAGYLLVET